MSSGSFMCRVGVPDVLGYYVEIDLFGDKIMGCVWPTY